MNGYSRQSPVATATPPQATLSQPPEGIGGGGIGLVQWAANEPKRKANSSVDGKEEGAAEETDKTISVK
uniref:Uncharacterized protein n=1 Tax=Globodera rostochiensis TaxID=31243 RepID=A0A914HT46_GLORO